MLARGERRRLGLDRLKTGEAPYHAMVLRHCSCGRNRMGAAKLSATNGCKGEGWRTPKGRTEGPRFYHLISPRVKPSNLPNLIWALKRAPTKSLVWRDAASWDARLGWAARVRALATRGPPQPSAPGQRTAAAHQPRLRRALYQGRRPDSNGQSVPLAVPQLGSCASSGRAWRLRTAWHSDAEATPKPLIPPSLTIQARPPPCSTGWEARRSGSCRWTS